eukprot:147731_1
MDKEMQFLQKTLNQKREQIRSIRGNDRLKHNKFLTNFNIQQNEGNDKDQKKNEIMEQTECFLDKFKNELIKSLTKTRHIQIKYHLHSSTASNVSIIRFRNKISLKLAIKKK